MTTPTKSYRLSTEALDKLERLATQNCRSHAQQLTYLINQAYEETMSEQTDSIKPTDSDELKPCPFCGGPAEVTRTERSRTFGTIVLVGCTNPSCNAFSEPMAFTKSVWNSRPNEVLPIADAWVLLNYADSTLNEYGNKHLAHVIRRTFRALEAAGAVPARKRRHDGTQPPAWDAMYDGLDAFSSDWLENASLEIGE